MSFLFLSDPTIAAAACPCSRRGIAAIRKSLNPPPPRYSADAIEYDLSKMK
jgi:hypothetical protein